MDLQFRDRFMGLWNGYFNGAELPIAFYYTDTKGRAEMGEPPSEHRCVIADLSQVRQGKSVCFDTDAIGCGGGKRYLGFADAVMPDFEYFLSCGIPGKLDGERYKKTPELVKEAMKHVAPFRAPSRFIVFKRWDRLERLDNPEVVIFFAPPDVLSGLFTLANFDQVEPNGVFAPFAAGCGSIVQYPYLEKDSGRPRGVLGMFDVSARPWVSKNVLTFAVVMKRFVQIIGNMEESFLITPSWQRVKKRIRRNPL
jgi:uncharacterized protein (DUF169 family)